MLEQDAVHRQLRQARGKRPHQEEGVAGDQSNRPAPVPDLPAGLERDQRQEQDFLGVSDGCQPSQRPRQQPLVMPSILPGLVEVERERGGGEDREVVRVRRLEEDVVDHRRGEDGADCRQDRGVSPPEATHEPVDQDQRQRHEEQRGGREGELIFAAHVRALRAGHDKNQHQVGDDIEGQRHQRRPNRLEVRRQPVGQRDLEEYRVDRRVVRDELVEGWTDVE